MSSDKEYQQLKAAPKEQKLSRRNRRLKDRTNAAVLSKLQQLHKQLISEFTEKIKYLDKQDVEIKVILKEFNKRWTNYCNQKQVIDSNVINYFYQTAKTIIHRFIAEELKAREAPKAEINIFAGSSIKKKVENATAISDEEISALAEKVDAKEIWDAEEPKKYCCGLPTKLTCEQCKYGTGKRNPEAQSNIKKLETKD